jgi:hypothetical protein
LREKGRSVIVAGVGDTSLGMFSGKRERGGAFARNDRLRMQSGAGAFFRRLVAGQNKAMLQPPVAHRAKVPSFGFSGGACFSRTRNAKRRTRNASPYPLPFTLLIQLNPTTTQCRSACPSRRRRTPQRGRSAASNPGSGKPNSIKVAQAKSSHCLTAKHMTQPPDAPTAERMRRSLTVGGREQRLLPFVHQSTVHRSTRRYRGNPT